MPSEDIKHQLIIIVLTFKRPGEIRRREVSWTLTKKLGTFVCTSEVKRREVVLAPQVSPEEIMSREVERGSERWTSFASVVTQHQYYGHCPCGSAPHSSCKSKLRGTLVATSL